MDEARIPTGLIVEGQLRRLSSQSIPAYVVNRGAYAAGLILVKINTIEEGCIVLIQQRDIEGELGWMAVLGGTNTVPEKEADAYIARAVSRDPDLWVIEVEDRQRRNPFEGKAIS
ncbi:MAG TPA: DUF1491 domain-containing protein [Rhodospirillaceae bacterium]|nr:DUF1491 domain-containing protein [Rhodospirillaceae bacterium]